jgi:hypothetical protein
MKLKTIRLCAEPFARSHGLCLVDHVTNTVEHLDLEVFPLSAGLTSRLALWYNEHESNAALDEQQVIAMQSELRAMDQLGIELLELVANEIGPGYDFGYEYLSVP